jgi:hypothetical protein
LEPFHVHCETCGARLKVRSEEVIGQIHACPKCDSMVQIVPPAGWSAIAAGTSLEFLAVGDDAIARSGTHTVAEATSPSEVRDGKDFAMPVEEVPVSAVNIFDEAAPAHPAAASGSSWLIWAVSGGAVLLVGGLAGALWFGRETATVAPPQEPAPRSPVVVNERATEPDIEDPAVEIEAEPAAGEPSAVVAETGVQRVETEALPSEQAAPVAKSEEVAAATAPAVEEPVAAAVPPLPALSEVAEAAEPDENVAGNSRPAPIMKLDPLNFDATELTLAPTTQPAAGSIPPNAEAVAESAENENVPPPDESLVAPKVDHSLTVRLGPMLEGAPRPHNVAEQLSLRVSSFEAAEMPLQQFVATVSDLTNVAITVDPIALELAGTAPRQLVSAQVGEVTVEKLLVDSLAKLRLGVDDDSGRVKIVMAGGEKRRAIAYDAADLVGAGDGKQLAALVQQFVSPESWKSGGGTIEGRGTKLHVDHTQNVRHQVLIFCERLRLARGLPLRSRYPAALLSAEPACSQLAAKLDGKATFTFLPWNRLGDVVRHWEVKSGVTILVDWSALADEELSPNSPVACSANDRSWQDVLDKTLEPIGLAWWPVSKDSIQVTSANAIEDVQRVEFYAISMAMQGEFASNDALIGSLQAELTKQVGQRLKPTVMAVDEVSGRLIVLGSPLVHRVLSERLAR